MNRRAVGTITHSPCRTPGKLYQGKRLSNDTSPSRKNSIIYQHFGNQNCGELAGKRSNSVGRIYVTSHCNSREHIERPKTPNPHPTTMINYDDIKRRLTYNLDSFTKSNQKSNHSQILQYCSQTEIQTSAKKKDCYQQMELHERSSNLGFVRQKSEKKIIKTVHNYQAQENPKQSIKKEPTVKNKENLNYFASMPRKEAAHGIASINHNEQKSQLENKLNKMINNYGNKNKEHSNVIQNVELRAALINRDRQNAEKVQQKMLTTQKTAVKDTQPVIKNQLLRQVFNKLTNFNLTAINLSSDSDFKLQQLWRSIHKQILLDEQLRISKNFINSQNIEAILTSINANRPKKIDINLLKIHDEEYDPFLIEKMNELLNSKSPNLTNEVTVRWIADNFIKCYEESQRHWTKHLSLETIECTIRMMLIEKQMIEQRNQGRARKELDSRDFTRYLSTLYKANLRSRNVLQIYSKMKGMPYMRRFIDLLEEKIGREGGLKKYSTIQ